MPYFTVLAKPMRKSGSASPIFLTSQQVPSARGTRPTICVALAPSSMRNAPRLVPKPPTSKAGTGMLVIWLRLRAKVVLDTHSKSAVFDRGDLEHRLHAAVAHLATVEELGGVAGGRGHRALQQHVADGALVDGELHHGVAVEEQRVHAGLDLALALGMRCPRRPRCRLPMMPALPPMLLLALQAVNFMP